MKLNSTCLGGKCNNQAPKLNHSFHPVAVKVKILRVISFQYQQLFGLSIETWHHQQLTWQNPGLPVFQRCNSDLLQILSRFIYHIILAIPFLTRRSSSLNPITIPRALFHSLEYTNTRNTDLELKSNKRIALNYDGRILKCQLNIRAVHHETNVGKGALLDHLPWFEPGAPPVWFTAEQNRTFTSSCCPRPPPLLSGWWLKPHPISGALLKTH